MKKKRTIVERQDESLIQRNVDGICPRVRAVHRSTNAREMRKKDFTF